MKAVRRLREILREVEVEAFEVVGSGGDLEAAMRMAYDRKISAALEGVHGIRSVAATGIAELVVGAGAGYATVGLSLLGPMTAAGISAAFMTGLHVKRFFHERRQSAWLGVMGAIADSVS
jgi:hypothetical protein